MNYLRRFVSGWKIFVLILSLVVLVGYYALECIPNTYESSAHLAIESADEFVFGDDSPDSIAMSQRVHFIISNVFRRENILRILEDSNVLEANTSEQDRSKAVQQFHDMASIDFDNVPVINSYTGKVGLMSHGLIVNYRDTSPELAYEITNIIVDDVLAGFGAGFTSEGSSAEMFLTKELEKSSTKLLTIGQQLSEFKNSNSLRLPELYPLTIRQLEDLSAQIRRGKEDISALRRDRSVARTDLATINPDALLFSDDGTRVESAEEKLEQLRVDYAFASSRYSLNHPEVIGLAREIEALEQHTNGGDTRKLEVQLNEIKARLATLKSRYANKHPDVVSATQELARLNEVINATARRGAPRKSSQPSNPAYVRMQGRSDALNEEIGRQLRRLEQLEELHFEQTLILAEMPAVELALDKLERLQRSEEQRYTDLEQQLTSAKLGSSMRGANLLGKIIVIDPPIMPQEPVAPRRNLLMTLLILLGLGAASFGVLVSLLLRDSIWDHNQLSGLVEGRIVQIPKYN